MQSIHWTSEAQANLLTAQQHKVAFRDVVVEKAVRYFCHQMETLGVAFSRTRIYHPSILRRILNVWVAACRARQAGGSINFPEELLVKDPLPVSYLLLSLGEMNLKEDK